jgi:nicotinamide-nucleotide amidase
VTTAPRLDISLADRTAAVLTVGTELTTGMVADTNASEISAALTAASLEVVRTSSVPDDVDAVSVAIDSLAADAALLVVTGGLGPTDDDLTREGASRALGLALVRDDAVARRLEALLGVHREEEARRRLMRQAEVLETATVLPAVRGSAPGMVAPTERGALVLLPGPPHEMRPLLAHVVAAVEIPGPSPRVLSCAGITESDALAVARRALTPHAQIRLTMLAAPGGVRVVLFADPGSEEALESAAADVAAALGDACYATDGSSLAEVVLRAAADRGASLGLAESCTGGLVAAELTAVPGASAVFKGSVVAYADALKRDVLGVDEAVLAEHGAVSEAVALEMAQGALTVTGATHALAITGVAGPGGGSEEKPVGTVWFAVAGEGGESTLGRSIPGDRGLVRTRATSTGLHLLFRMLGVAHDGA